MKENKGIVISYVNRRFLYISLYPCQAAETVTENAYIKNKAWQAETNPKRNIKDIRNQARGREMYRGQDYNQETGKQTRDKTRPEIKAFWSRHVTGAYTTLSVCVVLL